jgi:hypothetical protein
MTAYTFLCVPHRGAILAMDIALHDDDDQAVKATHHLFRDQESCAAVEIWDQERLVARIPRHDGATPPTAAEAWRSMSRRSGVRGRL